MRQLSVLILYYLRFFARLSLAIHKPFIIGIAGSVGKSSTKQAIYAILSDQFKTKALEGNSETGIPLSILGIEVKGFGLFDWLRMCMKAPFGIFHLKGITHLIVEMGIDDPYPPKNMEYLLTILKPHMVVSLNITPTHTMQFEKVISDKLSGEKRTHALLEAIASEDTKIFTKSGCKVLIYNKEDKYIASRAEKFVKSHPRVKFATFGRDRKATISPSSYEVSEHGTTITFSYEEKSIPIHFPSYILPEAYADTFAAALLVGFELGLHASQIRTSLEKRFSLPKGRSSLFHGIEDSLIIDSTYNGYSMLTFLPLLAALKKSTRREAIFLFGDIRELDSQAQIEHEKVAAESLKKADRIYLVGDLTKAYVLPYLEKHAPKHMKFRHFKTAYEVGRYLKDHIPHKAILLAKGSQNTIFLEEAVKMLLANPSDTHLLCRQEPYWLKIKEAYFKSHA